jgi:hypothetical protein
MFSLEEFTYIVIVIHIKEWIVHIISFIISAL